MNVRVTTLTPRKVEAKRKLVEATNEVGKSQAFEKKIKVLIEPLKVMTGHREEDEDQDVKSEDDDDDDIKTEEGEDAFENAEEKR